MNKHASLSILAALCAIMLSACASGPLYSDVKQSGALVPKKGKALALIYWKPRMQKGGGVRLYANDELLSKKMGVGSFYAYDAAPGPLHLASTMGTGSTGADVGIGALAGGAVAGPLGVLIAVPVALGGRKKDRAVCDVSAMETYYIEMYNGFWRENMKLVSKDVGEKGIEKCHWLNPPTN